MRSNGISHRHTRLTMITYCRLQREVEQVRLDVGDVVLIKNKGMSFYHKVHKLSKDVPCGERRR